MQTLQGNTEHVHHFDEFTIERINSTNLHDSYLLHQAVYGSSVPDLYYHKKYNTVYTGVINTAFIAYNRDHIAVAFYGVVPCYLRYTDDTIILSGQATDAMTHPGYRKKHLLTHLHQMVSDLCISSGIKFLFGFSNQNSTPIYANNFNWNNADSMDRFMIHVPVAPIKLLLGKAPFLKRIFRQYQKNVFNKCLLSLVGFENGDIKKNYCGVLRSPEYLEHKRYNDTMVISIGEAKVWLKIGHDIRIGDIELNGCVFDDVITGIKKLALLSGFSKIYFWANGGTFLHSLFIDRYQDLPGFPIIFKDLGANLHLNDIKFTFADIDTF